MKVENHAVKPRGTCDQRLPAGHSVNSRLTADSHSTETLLRLYVTMDQKLARGLNKGEGASHV